MTTQNERFTALCLDLIEGERARNGIAVDVQLAVAKSTCRQCGSIVTIPADPGIRPAYCVSCGADGKARTLHPFGDDAMFTAPARLGSFENPHKRPMTVDDFKRVPVSNVLGRKTAMKKEKGKYPGYRTMTGAQRRNERMFRIFDEARARGAFGPAVVPLSNVLGKMLPELIMPAGTAEALFNAEQGACILTDANMATEGDCTTHEHERGAVEVSYLPEEVTR